MEISSQEKTWLNFKIAKMDLQSLLMNAQA
jgi:hypothetical protein